MSFAFVPFYSGDYLRDTRHLSPLRHGIYFLLLLHCWDQKGPLPLDEQECAGIANCRSSDEIDALRYVIGRYFVTMQDGHYNQRMQKEIERAAVISLERSEAGKKGYQAKAKQLLSKSKASATTLTTTTTTTPTTTTSKENKELATATRFALPEIPATWEVFCQNERPDLVASKTFAQFKDYWEAKPGKDAKKLDWFATWRNWVRSQKAGPKKAEPVQQSWIKSGV